MSRSIAVSATMLFFVVASSALHGDQETWKNRANWAKLQEGMTEEQVVQILGLPTGRQSYPALDEVILEYGLEYEVTLSHKTRRVTAWRGPTGGGEEKWKNRANWAQLREGMTEQQVIQLLGPPTGKQSYPALDEVILLYGLECEVTLTYEPRRVTGWRAPRE